MSIDKNEISLLKACLQGDTGAFERIVSKYQGFICAVTYSATGDAEKSEELAHETFISAWRSLAQLKDLAKFRGWIGTIARNVVRNSFREKKRDIISGAASIDAVDESAVAADESDEEALAGERQAVVEMALKRIPAKYREVIVLFYRQEQSIKEVAAQLELSEATVKQRLSRGRKMLKEQAAEMIETTISRTGPSKAFTACVMGSVTALALKGAATAGAAVVAGGSSTGAASGLSALFSTAAAKIVTAAAVAVIAVGGTVVYNNMKSPPAQKDKPVQVADASQNNGVDEIGDGTLVEKNGDENIASLPPSVSIVNPVETGPISAAGDTESKPEVENPPQYIDPNTLTDIHYIATGFLADGSIDHSEESWIKKPNCWRSDKNNKTIINNGKVKLELDHKKMTAELSESSNTKALIPEYPQSKMVFTLIQIGRNLITGRDVWYGHDFLKEAQGYKLDPPSPGEKTSDGLMKYSVKITEGDGHGVMNVYVDIKTGLPQRMLIEVEEEGGRDQEYLFDYSEIDPGMFSLKTPDGYKEYAMRLSPKFQGLIFDKDLKPAANAEIYLMGSNDRGVKGTSNSEGEFNFYIPVGTWGDDEAMEYPVFVRAICKDYPGQVAWTVIQAPDSEYKLKPVIPSPGEIRRESKGKGRSSKCLAIHNVSLVLEPGASISGQVLDKVTGEPVANVMVELNASIKGKTWDLFDRIAGPGRRGDFEVKTDENGFYAFTCLPTFTWPKDTIDQAMKTYRSGEQLRQRTDYSLKVECDGYLVNHTGSTILTPKDSLGDRQIDFSLIPANVTIRGRVTDDDRKPIAGYQVEYCIDLNGTGTNCGGKYIRTNEKGEYEITGCAYHKSLSVRVESGSKPRKWHEEDATKDKEFVYYGYKYVPVEIEEGKLEYEVDIVLDKPEAVIVFDIKDTAGKPIEGMGVQVIWHDSIIGYEWAELLNGVSGKDGKCVIAGLPNMKGGDLRFNVGPSVVKKTAADRKVPEGVESPAGNKKVLNEKLNKYTSFYWLLEDLPDGKDGYVIEVTVPKKGERFDRKKRIKIFDSKGKKINR